jgi:hypothetical protein
LLADLDAALVALEAAVTTNTQVRTEANTSKRRNLDDIKLAQKFCELHACIVSIGFWLFNRESMSCQFAGGQWLKLMLEQHACFDAQTFSPSVIDSQYAMECLKTQLQQRRMFSLFQWDLPRGQALPNRRLSKNFRSIGYDLEHT